MKSIALLLFSLFVSSNLSAQYKFEKNGVVLSTTPQEVKDKNANEYGWIFEIAQLHNSTTTKKRVSFHVDMYYDGICSNCNNKEYQYTFILEPGETIKGLLQDRTSEGLKYFKEDTKQRITSKLSAIELTSFTVE